MPRIRRCVYLWSGETRMVDFADTPKNRAKLRFIDDYLKEQRLSFSAFMNQLTSEWLANREAKGMKQAFIDEYGQEVDRLADKLEYLHQEMVFPNPKHYPDWRTCLKTEGLMTVEAKDYSSKRGWKVE